MDAFLTSNTQKAMKYHKLLKGAFENKNLWYPCLPNDMSQYVNAFQTFFNSVDELDGSYTIQPLRMSDMEAMYPSLIQLLPEKGSNQFLYIFTCNSALPTGALVAHNILHI